MIIELRKLSVVLGILTVLLLQSGWCGAQCSESLIVKDDSAWYLQNSYFKRIISVSNGVLRTERLENKLSFETYRTDSDEFQLLIDDALYLTSEQFIITSEKTMVTDDGSGRKLLINLTARQYPFEAGVEFTIWPDKPYMRKTVTVRNLDKQKHVLSSAVLEKMRIRGVIPGSPDHYEDIELKDYYHDQPRFQLTDGAWALNDGQPVFGPDIFMGVEFPAAQNRTSGGGSIALSSYIYKVLQDEWVNCRSSVLGFSRKGRIEEAFMNYVSDIRVSPAKPLVVYNTWYDIRHLTEENMNERLQDFVENYEKPFGFMPDIFLLDDGWDDIGTVWEIDRERFPRGFHSVAAELKKHDVAIGLWVSPFGGYGSRLKTRIESARRKGFEITEHNQYCIGGEKYREEFKKKFLGYMKDYNVKFIKLDGIINTCNRTDHGHLPGEPSRAALTDAYIEIMQSLKEADPEVCLNITTGFWLSPWWLQYVDMGYPGGFDHWYTQAVPSESKRDASTIFRDKVLYDKFVGHNYMYPVSDLMLIGLIKGDLCMLGGYQETLEDWCNEVTLMLMRGYFCWELYITPALLNYDERKFMVEALEWGKENHDILSKTNVLSGDPYEREISVYAHGNGKRSIIGLRNPFIDSRDAEISIDASIYFPDTYKDDEFAVRELYPLEKNRDGKVGYGDKIRVPLDGFETKMIEIVPVSEPTIGTDAVLHSSLPERTAASAIAGGKKEKRSSSGDFLLKDIIIDEPENNKGSEAVIRCSFENRYAGSLTLLIEGMENVDSLLISAHDSHETINPSGICRDTTAFGSEHEFDRGDWRWEVFALEAGEHNLLIKISNVHKVIFDGYAGCWFRYDRPAGQENHEFSGKRNRNSTSRYPAIERITNRTHRLFYKPCIFTP